MRIDLPFFDKVMQNMGLLLIAALVFFILGRASSYSSNLLSRIVSHLPSLITDNTHRLLIVICSVYIAGFFVWWVWGL